MYKHSIRYSTKTYLRECKWKRGYGRKINYDQAALLFTNKDNCTETCKCNFVAKQKEE
jgi:hypothetical protein